MKLTNYHSHSIYCDGRARMEDFVRFAISRGLKSYGFSSHAPLPFDTNWSMQWDTMDCYLSEFERLKKKYKEQIDLYIGLEIDYLNEMSNPACREFQELPLDYRIGSVHMIYDGEGDIIDIDVSPDRFREIVDEHFYGDIECVVRLYFERTRRLLELGGFDILGHFEKIHRNASAYQPAIAAEKWYRHIVTELCEMMVAKGYIVEVNTKDLQNMSVLYPSIGTLARLKRLGAKIVVNSDAHYPFNVDSGLKQACELLAQMGFESVMTLQNGTWEEAPLKVPSSSMILL